MTEPLRTMLRDAADAYPDLALRGDPWRRGRRIRLARRAAGVAGATVTAAAVAAGTVLLTTPDLTSAPEPAREEPTEPALPDTLYEVPPNVPDISEDPLGEPAAVVYEGVVHTGVYSDATRPIVVGTETGTVRAVRDVGMGRAKLSPDGTKLAVAEAWRPSGGQDPPTVVVVELINGDISTHTLPDDGLGGGVLRLTWLPDSSSLAVTAIVTTEVDESGDGGSGRSIYGNLETNTGDWHEDKIGEQLAFSRDGSRIVVLPESSGGPTIQDPDGSDKVGVELAGTLNAAFSPNGQMLAHIDRISGSSASSSDPYALEIFDANTGERTTRVELGEYADVALVGWGERGVLINTLGRGEDSADGTPEYAGAVERIDLTDPDDPVRTAIIENLSGSGWIGVADAFVDADTRGASPPNAGFDWVRWVPEPFLLIPLGVVALFVVLPIFLRRRRRDKVLSRSTHDT